MYKTILLPIDLTHESSWGKPLVTALGFVGAFTARLAVVSVVREMDALALQYFPPGANWLVQQAETKLAALVAEKIPAEIRARTVVRYGGVSEEILRVADEVAADLIVMAAHRPEMRDFLLGSNADRVVRRARCSVLIVRG